jgi:hypothetical protein
MKYVLYILFLILTGCSAQYHLDRALRKNPDILDIEADTTITVDLSYTDTIVNISQNKPVKIVSDTITINDTIKTEKPINLPKKTYKSPDGIAHAELKIENSRIDLTVWSVMDTVLTLRKKLNITTQQKDSLIEITKKQEATITEKENWKEGLLRWAEIIVWIIGISFAFWLIIKLINLLR